LWSDEPTQNLYTGEGTEKTGLKGAAMSGELSPEMLGVGYLIGPRIACMMMAGAVISFFVIGPMIATFGEKLDEPVLPARTNRVIAATPRTWRAWSVSAPSRARRLGQRGCRRHPGG